MAESVDDLEDLAVLALLLDEEEKNNQREDKQKRIWVHDLWKKRLIEGEFATLYGDLVDHETNFFEYFRMSPYCFNLLLSKIENDIKKQDTFWRQAITPKERLAVCLRYPHDDIFLKVKLTKFGHKCCEKRIWKFWDFVKCLDSKKVMHKSCAPPAKVFIEMTSLPATTAEEFDHKTIPSAVRRLSSPGWKLRDLYLGPIHLPRTVVLSRGWENQAFMAEDHEKEAEERRSCEWCHERDWSRMRTAKIFADLEHRFSAAVHVPTTGGSTDPD